MEKVTLEEIEREKQLAKLMRWHSKFNFLLGHNGLREGHTHGLIGTTSAGKSTLLKAIIYEIAEQGSKVGVWLSEEKKGEYAMQLIKHEVTQKILDNIRFEHESDLPSTQGNLKLFHEHLDTKFRNLFVNGYKVLFIDNITTSKMYSAAARPEGQERICEILKNWNSKGMTIFWIGHTAKNVVNNNGRLVNTEDIRGLNFISMITEYFYCVTKITVEGKQANILEVSKHRFHEEAKGHFLLAYKDKKYIGDCKVTFSEIKTLMKNRDTFSNSDKKEKNNWGIQ